MIHGIIHAEVDGEVMRFGPGDVAGVLDSLGKQPRWYRARTEGPLVAMKVERVAWSDLLEDHVQVARQMVKMLSRAMLDLMSRTADV